MTSTAMQFIAFAFVLLANLASVDALSSRTMIAHGLLSCEDSSSIAARVEELEGPQNAKKYLQHVLKGEPECATALFDLGQLHMNDGDILGAAEQFYKCMGLLRKQIDEDEEKDDPYSLPNKRVKPQSVPIVLSWHFPDAKSSKGKLLHDAEQLQHLAQYQQIHPHYRRVAKAYSELASQMPDRMVKLPEEFFKVVPTYNRLLFNPAPPALPRRRRALTRFNPRHILGTFKQQRFAVVDRVLVPQAMSQLYRWLVEATIWWGSHSNGYVTTTFRGGLVSPLLVQVLRELHLVFATAPPGSKETLIPKGHVLDAVRAYKFDAGATGYDLQAEEGSVKFVLWLTPDQANRDPSTGGQSLCPGVNATSVDSELHKHSQRKVRAGAQRWRQALTALVEAEQSVGVSYRQNRLMVLDPRVPNKPQNISFAPGLVSRRISVEWIYRKKEENVLLRTRDRYAQVTQHREL